MDAGRGRSAAYSGGRHDDKGVWRGRYGKRRAGGGGDAARCDGVDVDFFSGVADRIHVVVVVPTDLVDGCCREYSRIGCDGVRPVEMEDLQARRLGIAVAVWVGRGPAYGQELAGGRHIQNEGIDSRRD